MKGHFTANLEVLRLRSDDVFTGNETFGLVMISRSVCS